jgi:hypothetical protein
VGVARATLKPDRLKSLWGNSLSKRPVGKEAAEKLTILSFGGALFADVSLFSWV